MSTTRECPRCGKPVDTGGRFCRSCGFALDTGSPSPPRAEKTPVVCPSCGDRNSPDASLCRSCGIQLRQAQPVKKKVAKQTPSAGNFFTSWKFVAFAAIMLAAIVIITRQFGTEPGSGSASSSVSRQIDSLRKVIAENPADAGATLSLANVLHDSHLYSDAVGMYGRYLRLQPADADARVDMGVSYFEMSFTDSIRQMTYLKQARDIIQQALTYAPKHQLALFNLGVIDLHLGDAVSAVQWLSKCIEVDSTAEIAHRARELVTQHPFTNQSPK